VKPSYRTYGGGSRPQGPRAAAHPTNRSLTARQRAALDAIHDSFETRGFAPTLREIGDAIGVRSTNGVTDHLLRLQAKGYLQRPDTGRAQARALLLTPKAWALYGSGDERSRERETDPGSVDEGET